MFPPTIPTAGTIDERRTSFTEGIVDRLEGSLIILSPAVGRPLRRVLFVNSYGGSVVWDQIKRGLYPPHHLWGCLELVRLGYEVALAEPLSHFDPLRRPFPHDLRLLRAVRHWLGTDGVLYCGHTLLYWLPLLKLVGALKNPIVSLAYARERLEFGRQHSGIIALTRAAAEEAKQTAPRVKVAHLGWGCDQDFYPVLEPRPDWFLSCGITCRDFPTLAAAAAECNEPFRLICPGLSSKLRWSPNVTVIDGGKGWNFQKSAVNYRELIHRDYGHAIASLIILENDPRELTAVGFTNLLESMALGRAVIMTRTGAIPGEIDVEAAGCGLHVPPADPAALARAVERLADDPKAAEAMGAAGRRLVEKHYNIKRYAQQLHEFFATL